MQLTIGRKQENCSLAVRTKRFELRRLFGLLFVISIVPPIVWGLGARVAQAEDREERTIGNGGEMATALLHVETSQDAVRRGGGVAAPVVVPPPPRESIAVAEPLSPSELYARAPKADALRAERIRTAERALWIRAFQSGEREGRVLMAQNDAPEDRPADLPADDETDDEATVDLSRIPAITAAPVLAPQVSAVGATSSSVGGGSLSSESPAAASEPAAPAPGAVVNIGSQDQPASGGPRSTTSAVAPEPTPSATVETRRRARTALHSAAAQAAAALASDSPYRNALSGQERYQAPQTTSSRELASIDDGLGQVSETLSFIPGLHLQSVSLFSGYSSNGISNQRNTSFSVGGDYDFGASATIAYLRNWRRTNLRASYTPTHSRRARFEEWNTTDHRLNVNAGHQLSRRWSIGAGASAANTGMEAFWFEAPVLRFVDAPPTSFDELFRMVEAGELTDDEFAAVLTGAPVVDDEGGQGFDLSRVLNVSASARARYAYSPRLSFNIGATASDTQLLQDPLLGRRISGIGRGNIANLRGMSMSASMGYALDRRTNLSANYSRSQQLTSLRDNSNESTSVGISRRIGRSWNVGASLGVGVVHWDNGNGDPTLFGDSFYVNQGRLRPTWTASGHLAYRWRAHRFQVQTSRTAGDSFGLGSRSTISGGGGWGWSTRDGLWSANASASYVRSDTGFGNGALANLLTRSIGAGLSRRLSSTTSIQTSYYFGEFDSPFRGLFVNNSVHRVQASFVWSPAQLR